MAKSPSEMSPVTIVALLRARILELQPEELELGPEPSMDVWGLVMEMGYPQEVVSLVVLADGSVSVYLKSGGGMIGCGMHLHVRAAGARMLRVAQIFKSVASEEGALPVPSDGNVRFYFHTVRGLRSIEVARAQLDEGEIELAELYYAGHAVIGAVELTGAGQPIASEIELAQASLNSEQATPSVESARRGESCRILPYAGTAGRR